MLYFHCNSYFDKCILLKLFVSLLLFQSILYHIPKVIHKSARTKNSSNVIWKFIISIHSRTLGWHWFHKKHWINKFHHLQISSWLNFLWHVVVHNICHSLWKSMNRSIRFNWSHGNIFIGFLMGIFKSYYCAEMWILLLLVSV